MRRRARWVLGLAFALVFLAWPAALGEYRGSDLLGNVAPQSQVAGGLVDQYPLSAYALDYHVDVGITNPDGVPPMIAQWAAAQLWNVTSFLVKAVIDLFTWAFSLDLLGGADGALAPIGQAISNLYENVIGQAWMVAAILIAGTWGIWKALVQRRYTETAGGLALSVAFVVIALFFVYEPERTVGQASQWTNTLSLAFLSGANRGALDDPDQAKREVADHLFDTLVYRPWVVLDFGGLSHCVDTDRTDQDGFPRPVGPHDPTRDVCRDHLRPGRDGHGGYAPRFLRQRPGSQERTAEYDALRKGQAPKDPQFTGYRVDKTDSPAVDVQQAGGAFQRLTFAVVIFLGSLGAVVLLGFLSLAVILAQVVALVLLGFAPVALVIGIFPGAGHDFFKTWLSKLATAVFIKALYSLVIAIVVAVSAALSGATGSLGFLFAFGLQTLFFWALFLYRKQITARLVGATSAAAIKDRTAPRTVVQQGAHAAAMPVAALVGLGRRLPARQESANAGAEPPPAAAPDDTPSSEPVTITPAPVPMTSPNSNGHGHHPGTVSLGDPPPPMAGSNGRGQHVPELPGAVPAAVTTNANGNGNHNGSGRHTETAGANGNGLTPATVNGNGLGPQLSAIVTDVSASASNGHAAAPQPVAASDYEPLQDPSPRDSHEDVMRRARELRQRAREVGLSVEERGD